MSDLEKTVVALSDAIRILADLMDKPLTARAAIRPELDRALESIRRVEGDGE